MNFVKNLINNLEINEVHEVTLAIQNYTLNTPKAASKAPFDLNSFLKSCRIPFLYGINRKDRELEKIRDFDGLFLRQYNRPADKNVAGQFEIKVDGKLCTAAVECKNLEDDAGLGTVRICIENFIGSKLAFLVGSTFKDSLETSDELAEIFTTNSINAFILKREGDGYKFIPFGPATRVADPEMVLLAIDVAQIKVIEGFGYRSLLI